MNILVIRSAPFEMVSSAIKALRKRFPEAVITLLVQEAVQNEYRNACCADAYLPLFPGFFSYWKARRYFRGRLDVSSFQRMVIVYNNKKGKGYRRMEWFFVNAGFSKVEGFFYDIPVRTCGFFHLFGLERLFFLMTAALVFPFIVSYIGVKSLIGGRRRRERDNG